jgi:hypothetical protein
MGSGTSVWPLSRGMEEKRYMTHCCPTYSRKGKNGP